MLRLCAWWLVMLMIMTACTPVGASRAESAAPGDDLLVYAAASLTDAFSTLGDRFSAAHPGTHVTFNFAGSQQLAQQLAQGAPGDVFAAANQRQMQAVMDTGRIADGAARIFVRNRLVVIVPAANPAGLVTLQDLARPGIKLVLAAPEVPVGAYSAAFLDKAASDYGADYAARVRANVMSYEENVRFVVSKVALGEADAGIVYVSDVTGETAQHVGRITIPDHLNIFAEYPLAALSDAKNPALAQAFVDYVLGPEGQAILAEYGLIPAAGP
jgi:molybdate transport system substrate-binding protein